LGRKSGLNSSISDKGRLNGWAKGVKKKPLKKQESTRE